MSLAIMIDTTMGKILIALITMCLFAYANPVLAVLGLFVAFELIRRSMVVTGSSAMELFYPTEENKWKGIPPRHQFPYTLEQEMVNKMTSRREYDFEKAAYRPSLDNIYEATFL
jgi:hypothetical protein